MTQTAYALSLCFFNLEKQQIKEISKLLKDDISKNKNIQAIDLAF